MRLCALFQMIKVLFVCHGNICRSPMAMYLFRDMVNKKGQSDNFIIESKATSKEELGNKIYPPIRNILSKLGIDSSSHRASQINFDDFKYYDYIIGFDEENMYNLNYLAKEYKNKIYLLSSFSGLNVDVYDPWYSRNFDKAYNDINNYLKDFYNYLISNNL